MTEQNNNAKQLIHKYVDKYRHKKNPTERLFGMACVAVKRTTIKKVTVEGVGTRGPLKVEVINGDGHVIIRDLSLALKGAGDKPAGAAKSEGNGANDE